MKKLIILSLTTALLCGTVKAGIKNNAIETKYLADELGQFYNHLMQTIQYPSIARSQNYQGNSIITFTLVKGSLKHLNVQTELGNGCDIAVLNSVMAYTKLNTLKDGLYALKTSFRIQGANTTIINEPVKMPIGFTALNTVTIMAQAATNAQSKKNDPKSIKIIGYGSVNNGKEPLYVVDGKVSSIGLNELDPNNIESVSILKDASTVSLYGKEGANGVIIVTTKNAGSKSITGTEIPAAKQTEASKNDEITVIGYGSNVILRGKNTYGKTPMYVLDGKVMENASINEVDPNKIESISVLKDASAIALYGPEAYNGVVVITTKKEAVQKTKKQ